MSVRYFLQFTTASGQVLSLDGGSLYEVEGLHYGAQQTLNIGSQSTGAGAGKISFDPLSFTLGSSELTTYLDQIMASGTSLKSVNLYAVKSGGGMKSDQAVPFLTQTFKLAAMQSDAVDLASGQHSISMAYGGLVETVTGTQSDGTPTSAVTGGWNAINNIIDLNAAGSLAGGTKAAFASAATSTSKGLDLDHDVASQTGGGAELHLYAQIRDGTGRLLGGQSQDHWIELDAAGFSNTQTLSLGAQTAGAGAGKIGFDPLSLTFKPGTLEPLLLQTMAQGKTLQVEIAAVREGGEGGAHLVDDYRFGTAAIATSERSLGDGGSLTYTLQYGQEAASHYDTDPTGWTVLAGSQGWDRVKNVALQTADGASGGGLPAQAATVKTDWSGVTNPGAGTGEGGEPTTGGGAPLPPPEVALAHDTGVGSSDGVTSDATLTARASIPGASLYYSIDSQAAFAASAYDPTSLSDGFHTIAVTQMDGSGHGSAATTVSFILDRAPPVLTLGTVPSAAVTATSTSGASVAFSASATDALEGAEAVTFTESVNGTTVAVQSGATFAIGTHTITATSGDGAGNTVQKDLTFTVAAPGPHSGKAIDGYLAGATVFADANGNGQLDQGETSTTTDANGNFTLAGGFSTLVTQGGTDISTGLPFTGTLKAPAGSTVVTPLTTIAVALATQGVADPVAAAKAAFGLPAGFDLTNTDPVAASANGDATALTALKAGAAVANTLAQITAGLQAGGAAGAAAEASAVAALAAYVAANTTVDLTGAAVVTQIAADAGVTAGTAATVGASAAGTNAQFAAALDATALATIQAAAQGGGGSHGGGDPGQTPVVTTVPVLNVSATTDGLVNASEAKAVSFTVTGLAGGTGAVAAFSDGTHTQTVTLSANGTATVDLSGFDGTVTSSLTYSDAGQAPTTVGGNSLLVDTTAPAPRVTGLSGAGDHASGHLLSGDLAPADAGLTVTVRDGSTVLGTAVSDGQGHFSFAFADTKPGAVHGYDLTVTATDAAGNVGTSADSHFAFDYTANAALFGTFTHDASSHLGQIYALYEGLLGRAPDQAGLRAWVDALDHGGSLKDVTQGFLVSPEAVGHLGAGGDAAFVDALYAGVLNRAADAGGRQGYLDALAQGMSRAEVADSFVFSPEHLGQLRGAYAAGIAMGDPVAEGVARLYHGLLDRAPDAGGLSGWTAVAHAGQPLSAVAAGILGSQEYIQQHTGESDAAFVEGLYQHALGRAAEPAGEQWQLSALSHGTSRADLALSITESGEAQAHLAGSVGLGWHLA